MATESNFTHENTTQKMSVEGLPALSDNYMYIITCKETGEAAVVDPVEPQKVLNYCQEHNLNLTTILTTHHHWDHSGGNIALKNMKPDIVVYGGKGDNAPGVEIEIGQGDKLKVGNLTIQGIHTPCHTQGHVCYYVDVNDGPNSVFTGDTLFVGGCGHFFDGTPKQMHSAFKKLGALPDDTLVYVGHEYTVANLKYAKYAERENELITQKLEWAEERRNQNKSTMPSTMAEEHATNPFMRCADGVSNVLVHFGTENTVEALGSCRQEKSAGTWKKSM